MIIIYSSDEDSLEFSSLLLASNACFFFLTFHICRLADLVFDFLPFDFLRGFSIFEGGILFAPLLDARGMMSLLLRRGGVSLLSARGDESFLSACGGVMIFRAPGESNKFYLIIIYGS